MFARFVDRPVLAGVISVLITLIGAVAGLTLPIAQFPEIAPPIINIQATYPGASAQQAYEAIAIPLEQEINGAQNLLYINSTSNTDGSVSMDATFEVGSDLDAAAAEVLTRANRAEAKLPPSVNAQGLEITKSSRQRLGNIVLYAEDGAPYDELFLANWAETQVIKPLRRVQGMGRIVNFSNKRYAMRIWLDPLKMEALGISPGAVTTAITQQNAQITTGTLGKPPVDQATAFELQLVTQGRLRQPEEFGSILLRANPDGSVVRIRDVARVELGSEQYGVRSSFDGAPSATLGLYQNPDANAVQVMEGARATMVDLAKRFPPGLKYKIALDRTEFVKEAIFEVVRTLFEALVLVVIVTYLFLQNWRATLIPAIAVPVALVGTFGPMALLGFSFNTLSLLGMVLAVGLVVDDAIIVVENTERLMDDGMAPPEASREAVTEVAGPVIATTLVLAALFVPVAFIPGLTGKLYNQFALTIAISVLISAVVSLTLTPALCGLILRHRGAGRQGREPVARAPALVQRRAGGREPPTRCGDRLADRPHRPGRDRLRALRRPDRVDDDAAPLGLRAGRGSGLLLRRRGPAEGGLRGAHRQDGRPCRRGPAGDPERGAHDRGDRPQHPRGCDRAVLRLPDPDAEALGRARHERDRRHRHGAEALQARSRWPDPGGEPLAAPRARLTQRPHPGIAGPEWYRRAQAR